MPFKKTLETSPNLNPQGLRGGTLYWDAQFDDARLAIAMARTAISHGGVVVNHTQRGVAAQKRREDSGRDRAGQN